MNKSLIGIAAGLAGAVSILAAPVASAHDHVSLSLNFGLPSVAYPAAPLYRGPIYDAPQVVYQRPQPVYVTPAPVYYSAPPVYVQPAPVYYYGYAPVRYWNHEPHFYGHEHRRHWR